MTRRIEAITSDKVKDLVKVYKDFCNRLYYESWTDTMITKL